MENFLETGRAAIAVEEFLAEFNVRSAIACLFVREGALEVIFPWERFKTEHKVG